MRRTGNLFKRVIERENLRLALSRALRAKRSRHDARTFANDMEHRFCDMAERLADRAGRIPSISGR